MLNYIGTELNGLVNKYKQVVSDKLESPNFRSTAEGTAHTRYLADCQRGSIEAKEYVLHSISNIVDEILTNADEKVLNELVERELIAYNQKQYETVNLKEIGEYQEASLTYYQLLELCSSKYSTEYLKQMQVNLNTRFLAVQVLSEEIYAVTRGIGLLESLMKLRINNIEVHDTKIRIETATGNWFTIVDYRFDSDKFVRKIAERLLNQDAGGDLTEDECERQSILLDGSRITVALKPASTMNTIFIKRFDNYDVSLEQMIKEGSIPLEMKKDLETIGRGRANVVFSGGVNSGKSTMLKAYVEVIPNRYKIGFIDPTKDTDLKKLYPDKDIITLYETGTYTMNDQFSLMLTMNRDVIGISESKSYEILQSIKSMTRANPGSFLTMHNFNPADLIDNIAWMCLENGIPQDIKVLRGRIASALDINIRLRQLASGKRVVDSIVEIVATGDIDKPFEIRAIWKWDVQKGQCVRCNDYKMSGGLEEKFLYWGCSLEEVRRFNNEV